MTHPPEEQLALEDRSNPSTPSVSQSRSPDRRGRRAVRKIGQAGRAIAARHGGLALAWVVYAWGAMLLLPTYRWQINPDGVGYLSVARELLDGKWFNAINAYWSPLVSWLMVPLLACGLEPVLAFKLLSLALGAAGIAAAWWLMANLRVPRLPRTLMALALAPMMIGFALQVITADLIVAVVLLAYLAHLSDPRTGRRVRGGAMTGVWMALAYLAKAYALWFVTAHYLLVSAYGWFRSPDRAARRQTLLISATALGVFLLLSTAWAGVLTCKFGHFTYGSTGQFNWAYNGPDFQQPMHAWGLLAPPNDSAVSAWDDATYFHVKGWNPLTPQRNWDHFKKNLQRNYRALLKLTGSYSVFAYFILVGALLVAGSAAEPTPRRPHAILAVALLLYPCGYLLLHLEDRFFWLLPTLLVVLGASVPAALGRTAMLRGRLGGLLITLLAAASFAYPAWVELTAPHEIGKTTHELADRLKPFVPAGAPVAADGQWDRFLYVSFYNGLRYFGVPEPRAAEAKIQSELDEHHIQYFFVTGGRHYAFLRGNPPLTTLKAVAGQPAVRIYRLR